MTNHYSTYFNITHEDLVNRGVYNAFLDKDSLLHIDPLLLKDCTIPVFITIEQPKLIRNIRV